MLMRDLVDRSRVMNDLFESHPIGFNSDDIAEAFKEAPTIDAVPVIRCKDCKLFKEYTELFRGSSGYDGACRILAGYTDCDREMRRYMDYCSFGERKMNAEVEG